MAGTEGYDWSSRTRPQIYAGQLCLDPKQNQDSKWTDSRRFCFVGMSRAWFLAAWLRHPQPRGNQGESQGALESASGLSKQPAHHKRPLVFCSDRETSRSAQFWLQAANFRQILFQRFTFPRLFLTLSTTSVILLIKEDLAFSRN